jgi:hypothetical protein
MEQKIRIARMISARLIRFYEARRSVGKLIYQTMRDDTSVVSHLKRASAEMDGKILYYENEVKCSIESLPGFNPKTQQAPCFLSFIDLEDGVIDISKKLDKSQLLDLTTGEIVGS